MGLFPIITVVVVYEYIRYAYEWEWYIYIPVLGVTYIVAMGLGFWLYGILEDFVVPRKSRDILRGDDDSEERSKEDGRIERRWRITEATSKWAFWLVLIAGALCVFLLDEYISKKTRNAIALFGGACIFVWFLGEAIKSGVRDVETGLVWLTKRVARIENALQEPRTDNIEERLSRPVSYELRLILIPHWIEIIEEFARRRKQSSEALFAVLEARAADYKDRKGLCGKDFHFRIFGDEASGLRQIWSDHDRTFVDRIIVSGDVFDPGDQLPVLSDLHEKYIQHEIPTGIECTPGGLSLTGESFFFKSFPLAMLPYRRIERLLLNLGKCDDWGAEHAIKTFPKQLQKEMDENSIKYDNDPYGFEDDDVKESDTDLDRSDDRLNAEEWFKSEGIELYDEQDIDWNAFHAPYYTASFCLKVFPKKLVTC
jgi:hypothetical protein